MLLTEELRLSSTLSPIRWIPESEIISTLPRDLHEYLRCYVRQGYAEMRRKSSGIEYILTQSGLDRRHNAEETARDGPDNVLYSQLVTNL